MYFLRRHRYELVAALTGATVMMLEIVGARLIAPFFGTSTYVWTAMIGVILGALSLGFYYGGRLADRDRPAAGLELIISGAAVLVLVMVLFQQPVLELLARQRLDLRLSAVLAAITLFGVPSFLIGMVSPHLAKIRVTSLKTTGATIGRLEAAGSLGSIAGTFLSGYVLLAYFGARNLSIMLAVTLVLTSFLIGRREFLPLRFGILAAALALLLWNPLPAGVLADKDTAYSRFLVREGRLGSRPFRTLLMDGQSIQSAAYADDFSEPAAPYIARFFDVAAAYDPSGRILVVGGGAHSFPVIWQHHSPDTAIDVVELDPGLREISERYFGFEQGPQTRLFYEDGRSFLNRARERYDLIFMDAYSSLTPPFQLSSIEAVRRLDDNLGEHGVVVVNAAATYHGFLPSLVRTYGAVFPHLAAYSASPADILDGTQNFIILASRDAAALERAATRLMHRVSLPAGGMVLTDDFAPVERLSY